MASTALPAGRRLSLVVTIEHRLVIRRLGTLSAADQAALTQAIAEIVS